MCNWSVGSVPLRISFSFSEFVVRERHIFFCQLRQLFPTTVSNFLGHLSDNRQSPDYFLVVVAASSVDDPHVSLSHLFLSIVRMF
jgi:hypothetical protein